MFQRGPDGMFHEFHTTRVDDEWQPIPGQDWALIDAVHGAGWFTVVSCRPIYQASTAHPDVAAKLAGEVTVVYLKHMEVFLEKKKVQDQVALLHGQQNRHT